MAKQKPKRAPADTACQERKTADFARGKACQNAGFVLVDFTHMNRAGCLRLYEAGHTYALSQAIAHAATKRELVAKQRPRGWVPPNMFQLPKVLTEAEVIEAEAEFKALQRHALELVDPEAES